MNDEHGHGHPGTPCFAENAASLISELRSTDAAGRYGGEETIILMPQNTPAGAAVMA